MAQPFSFAFSSEDIDDDDDQEDVEMLDGGSTTASPDPAQLLPLVEAKALDLDEMVS